ncbi:ComEC/Rec2 family competence protein [Candidatus Uhrbacteria bacterium]|nr:ComEC/Rec2 family competence protein [Candidatus Uhrbacteria bacterium]
MLARTPSNVLSAILLFGIAMAPVRAMFMVPAADSVAHISGEYRVAGDVVDVNPGESTAGLTLANVTVDDLAKSDRVLVTAPRYPASRIGDRVSVVCTLERPAPFDGFAYDTYLAIRDIHAVCRVQDAPLVVGAATPTLLLELVKLRAHLMDRVGRVLPEPQATLLSGLLLGRADFSSEWRDRFLATGTTHIVAASGFNVSLVVMTLFGALTWVGIRRQRAFGILVGGIALYAVLAGLEPAVVRAGVMAALVLAAHHVGRKTSMRNIVLLAVAAMLAFEPRLLLHDVGFQLSVISTVALIWFAPLLAERLRWVPSDLELRDILASTLAATCATLPIVILSFGQVSFLGPIVNLLVLPLVPPAMTFGALGLLGSIHGPTGPLLALPAWTLLSAVLWIITSVGSLPFSAVAIPDTLRYVLAAFTGVPVLFVCHRVTKKR